jgi:glycosyltransferase involved in cell wall biosynthesis
MRFHLASACANGALDVRLANPHSGIADEDARVRGTEIVALGRHPRVLFCGPIAPIGQAAGGGHEAANRRTCDALAARDLEVLELPYPRPHDRAWSKASRYALTFLHHAAYVMFRRSRYDVLHLTPLNMQFAWAESLLIACARVAGRPTLMDIRAGTFVRHYHGAGNLYRRAIDLSLRLAGRVAVEGREYIAFVRQRHGRAPFYFPNYVTSRRVAPTAHGVLRIIYVGRIVPEKGIDTALQATAALVRQGLTVRLDLVGDGPSAYIDMLRWRHPGLPVCWHGALPPGTLLPILAGAHFFLFPSRHDGEGHSNALNEAMALGVVPISSRQGFSPSVVGDSGTLLRVDAPAEDYASAMLQIVIDGRWSVLSSRASARVGDQFSEDATLPGLIEVYRGMLEAH